MKENLPHWTLNQLTRQSILKPLFKHKNESFRLVWRQIHFTLDIWIRPYKKKLKIIEKITYYKNYVSMLYLKEI